MRQAIRYRRNLLGLALSACTLAAACRTPSSDSALRADAAAPASCAAQIGDDHCDYYSCLEQDRGCGPDGYPVGYGARYCKKFHDLCGGLLASDAAKQWVKGTTKCLQKSLADAEPEIASCDDLADRAFATHAYCYVTGTTTFGGVSFCELSPSDWVGIRGCVAASDRYSVRGYQQIVQTALRCIGIFSGGFFLEGDGDEAERRFAASLPAEERRRRIAELQAFVDESSR